jgi:uncharacterized protein (TIGR02611 family)
MSAWAERLAERRRRHQQRHPVYRALFAVAGAGVTLAGVAMLILPGPAFVIIPVGLGMLAMEFRWAEVALGKALARAERAQASARRTTPLQRGLAAGALVLAAAAATVAVLLWNIPVLPDS